MDPGGLLTIKFTREIKNTDEIRSRLRRMIAADQGLADRLIQLLVLKGDEAGDDDVVGPILRDWSFQNIDSKSIQLQLHFESPMEVSQGDSPDLLLIQLMLSELESIDQLKFPSSVVKYSPLIRQIQRQEAADLQSRGSFASTGTAVGVGGGAAVALVLSMGLDQVWSLINELQILQHERLFNAKLPANINAFSNSITIITSVQPIDFEETIDSMVYIPEREPYSLNLKSAGYDTNLSIVNGQGFVTNYSAHALVCLVPLTVSFYYLKRFGIYAQKRKQILKFVFWNGTLRLLIEGYTDMTLFALINIKEMEWPGNMTAVAASNYFAMGMLAINGLLLLLPLAFCCCLRKRMTSERSRERFETLFEGTKHEEPDSVKTALTVSLLYFSRRMSLCISLVFMDTFFWGQIAMQFFFSSATIIFLLWFRPLDSSLALKVEIMNEVTNLLLQYMLLCFTDFVPEAETREQVGAAQIWLVIAFLVIHLMIILTPLGCQCRYRAQRCHDHGYQTCLPYFIAKRCCKPCIRRSVNNFRSSQGRPQQGKVSQGVESQSLSQQPSVSAPEQQLQFLQDLRSSFSLSESQSQSQSQSQPSLGDEQINKQAEPVGPSGQSSSKLLHGTPLRSSLIQDSQLIVDASEASEGDQGDIRIGAGSQLVEVVIARQQQRQGNLPSSQLHISEISENFGSKRESQEGDDADQLDLFDRIRELESSPEEDLGCDAPDTPHLMTFRPNAGSVLDHQHEHRNENRHKLITSIKQSDWELMIQIEQEAKVGDVEKSQVTLD